MSSRQSRSNQAPPPASGRQNEYFVPRDGIDREVITADVCRYLGNDALVRPGVYESPQTGQVVQGYYITAYRNLTSAMIEDLKADSARWDQERRQQTARNPVGVQYRNSATHESRQYYGPTGGADSTYQDNSRDSYDATPRYPGTGSAGYSGASGGYPPQSYGGNQGGYGGQGGYTTAQPQQFAQSPADVSYPGGAAMSGSGFGQPSAERPYTQTGAHMAVRGGDTPMYGTNDPYAASPRDRIPVTTMAQGRPTYVTSGPPPSQGFPAAAFSGSQFVPTDSRDPFYGRASPAGNPAYGTTHDSQYDTAPAPRASAPPSNAQMASSGSSSRHNRESVERDRHAESRHRHRSGR
ncbi:hypothetical protein JX265_001622 [Neoarthrinium moseri]|uniref:Transcription factor RfeG n=1 Tax=Neoarthrinium moseri TaxID=1658444 RepID=A0A9P9WVY0_9PEZI|nr:uncharacterized protein JN550_004017 [Neoarthrinium moseri]KAI1851262.1 hypothetical protein JX266_003337 [Neoarthrinium moseri]KAI1872298.1 hypothetical protein JN550_004017 [Neoarthrinium moseri]KAI1880001.1 hypothetical protein JX265_001622 [Neoarthrinium moseri]